MTALCTDGANDPHWHDGYDPRIPWYAALILSVRNAQVCAGRDLSNVLFLNNRFFK